MDIATIVGIVVGFGLVIGSILIGGPLGAFFNVPGILIVVGGTFAATLISEKLAVCIGAANVAVKVFLQPTIAVDSTIGRLADFTALVRKDGPLALENEEIPDRFMAKGVRLAVDGLSPEEVRGALVGEMQNLRERHREGQRVFKFMASTLDRPTDAADPGGREIIRAVDEMLLEAITIGASDVHIQPTDDGLRVRARVDGRVRPLMEFSQEMSGRAASRLKVLAGADISERPLHQDGKIFVRTDRSEVDIRVSSYVSVHGENLVLRLLDRNRGLVPLDRLGFAPKVETVITDIILPSASGLVLVTGPTGSGKTTTLYSLVQDSLDPEEIVISAEDPVEFVIDGIVQCNVNEKTGPTFVDSLRAMLRQDPDTIIVGEMRDDRTVKMAFESALTGHKVFSTFHTDNAVSAIIRLLEIGVAPFLVASALSAIVAQRLIRRVCKDCAEEARPTRQELRYLGLQRSSLDGLTFARGRGCARCGETGYRGRLGIHEVLIPGDDFKEAILTRAPARELETLARQTPQFMTLQEDGMLKATHHHTSIGELIANVPRDLDARPLSTLQGIAGVRRNR